MNKSITLLFFIIISLCCFAQEIEIEKLLNEFMLKEASIDVKLINSIDYTPNGFLLLSSINQFYILGIGRMKPVLKEAKTSIDAFTVTQDNALWVVNSDNLCFMDSLGSLSALYDLPISNAGIVSGNYRNMAYIYDRTYQEGKEEYAIYRSSDKLCVRLASTSAPILSAFEYKESLLFSSGNTILCADQENKTFFEFFSLPQQQNIISITGDTTNHALYFSTQDTIYRIQNGQLEYICMEFGGVLKYDGEGLLIFKPEESLIIRFRNNILYPSQE